ncbi:competence protein CoiA [Flavobacterium lindanitolerans]|jgi:competence protein CoiA|uniref:competence protein CoiA n=1 Tax=Flavobacterium lindanitolerans TaxID=428988 RepID=UPI0023F24C6B|nr:competence protein CoiA family protein [Flavobacterium lindanitolerans]
MKFAIVDDNKIEAYKGAKGFCQSCGAEMVAKCGEFKINHWAHKKNRQCDTWWEIETEWHREWKGYFPIEWQEIIQFDRITNEKHIADVRTDKGLVVEFQHSHINPIERRQREHFYKNMIWVVDGTRLQRDFPRFIKAQKDFVHMDKPKIFGVEFADECFPKNWLGSSVPVIFDFNGTNTIKNEKNEGTQLYCIFPIQVGWLTIFAEMPRKTLVKSIIDGEWQTRYQNFINDLIEHNRLKAQQAKLELERQQAQARHEFNRRLLGWKFTGRRRRF